LVKEQADERGRTAPNREIQRRTQATAKSDFLDSWVSRGWWARRGERVLEIAPAHVAESASSNPDSRVPSRVPI